MPPITGTTARKMYRLHKGLMQESEEMLGEDGCDQTLSQYWGYPLQAHHCISCSVMSKLEKRKLAKKAEQSGYDINGRNNGIALPAYFGHQMLNKEMRHRGGHWDEYYDNVKKKLLPIYKKYKDKDLCENKKNQKNILADLQSAENDIKSKLKNKKWWLYDWSDNLYNGDYRDEGDTNLRSARKREGASETGESWFKKYGSAKIKRRYKVSKGKEKVRTEWYGNYGYPVPSGLRS